MKVDLDTSYRPYFQANVSEKFVNAMRGYFNSGENRLKNNYRLNKKIEEYKNFGYKDYTVELHKKAMGWDVEYSLVAVKEGMKPQDYIILAKRNSFRKIVQRFIEMRRGEFKSKFR